MSAYSLKSLKKFGYFLSVSLFLFVFLINDVFAGNALIWVSGTASFAGDLVIDSTGLYNITEEHILKSNSSNGQSIAIIDAVWEPRAVVDSSALYHTRSSWKWEVEKRNLDNLELIDWASFDDIGTERVFAIAVDSTGVYLAGYSCGDLGLAYWRVEKRSLNNLSNIIWARDAFTIFSTYSFPRDMAIDSSGLYVVGAYQNYQEDVWYVEKRNLINGNLIWVKGIDEYPGSDAEIAYSVAVDSSGVYVVGYQNDGSNIWWRVEKRELDDEYNSNGTKGEIMWAKKEKFIAGPGADNIPYSVAVDSDGIYIIGYDNTSGFRWRLEKRDLNSGDLQWSKILDDASVERKAAILVSNEYIYVSYRLRIRKMSKSGCDALPGQINWTDPTITPNVTKIRAIHINELRSWINNQRQNAWRADYSWTDSIIADTSPIRAVHFAETRNAIQDVYYGCEMSTMPFSGASVLDYSGNNNTGATNNKTVFVINNAATPCKFGYGCYKFYGGNQFYGESSSVNTGNSASLDITGGITVSAWIKPTGIGSREQSISIKKGTTGSGWRISYEPIIALNASQPGGFAINFGGWDYSNSQIVPDQWTHIAVARDSSGGGIYINGSLDKALVGASINSSLADNHYIGKNFDGFIDEFMVFNRALTSTEIQQIYNTNNPPAGLVGWWRFDESEISPGGQIRAAHLVEIRNAVCGQTCSW